MEFKNSIVVAATVSLSLAWIVGCGSTTQPKNNTVLRNSSPQRSANITTSANDTSNNATTSNTTMNTSTDASNPLNPQTSTPKETGSKTSSEPNIVYVFSQKTLEEMYTALYVRTVGPIVIPQDVSQNALEYAPKVSLQMLQYVPPNERNLDQQLVQQIRNWNNRSVMELIPELPGYQLNSYSHPTGSPRQFWDTTNWPKWVYPTLR